METAQQFETAFDELIESGTANTGTAMRYGIRGDTFASIIEDSDALQEMFPESTRVPALIAPFVAGKGVCISMACNNSIVQDVRGAKVAVVPTFGVKALDKEALRAFEKAGYKTVAVPFTEISLYGAGPHCAALEIREPVKKA